MAHTRHGWLVINYPLSGDKYEGEWVLGKRHGKGRYTSHNGDMYEGEYKDGKRSGVGLYTYSNGDQYEGEWKNGKKQGQGIMTFSNGAKYEGYYKDDLKAYRGRYTHADGSMYTGEYKMGKPSGRGMYEYPTVRDGTWDCVKCETALGIPSARWHLGFRTPSREKYEGEFAVGLKHGQGRVTLSDGMCYNAKYHLGKRASRKKLVALPWGFGAEDDEDEERSLARDAAHKASQRHSTAFAFLQPDAINKHLPSSKAAGLVPDHSEVGEGAKRRGRGKVGTLMIENGTVEYAKGDHDRGGKSGDFESGLSLKGREYEGKEGEGSEEDMDVWEMTAHKMVKPMAAFNRSSVGAGPGTEDSHLVAKKGKHTLDGVVSPNWAGKQGASEDGREQDARKLFDAIDIDKSGTLSPAEVRTALMKLGFSNAKIALLFATADVDNDGSISFNEFRQGLVPLMAAADDLKKELRTGASWSASSVIDVFVHGCRNIPVQRDGDHKLALPFVQITCGDQKKQSKTGKEGETNPSMEGKFTFYLDQGADRGTLDFAVLDWDVEGASEVLVGGGSLQLQRLLANDTIGRQWYAIHKGGQRVAHQAKPTQVLVRTAHNLPLNDERKVDPYVRVTVAGQVRTSQVIKNSTQPEFHQTFDYNLFAEDLMSELVVAVVDWSAESRAGSGKKGGVIGQIKVPIHDLLTRNKSKDGWCTLLDTNNQPVTIGPDGRADTAASLGIKERAALEAAAAGALVPVNNFARINLRVRCRLRQNAAETDSEMGKSKTGTASPYQGSLLGSHEEEEEESTEEDEGSAHSTEDGDQGARRQMQPEEDDSDFFSFVASDRDPNSSSATHSSLASSLAPAPRHPSRSNPRSAPVSSASSRHPRGAIPGPASSSRAALHSASSRVSEASAGVSTGLNSGSGSSRTPGNASYSTGPSVGDAGWAGVEASLRDGGPGSGPEKALSRSEEVQLNKLRKRTAKALANGEHSLAQQYRRDISRLLGQPFLPEPPLTSNLKEAQPGQPEYYSSESQGSASQSASASGSYSVSEAMHSASVSSAAASGYGSRGRPGAEEWEQDKDGSVSESSGFMARAPEAGSMEAAAGPGKSVRWNHDEAPAGRGGDQSERGMESGSRGGFESGLESVVEEGAMASSGSEPAAAEGKKEGKKWSLLPKFVRKQR